MTVRVRPGTLPKLLLVNDLQEFFFAFSERLFHILSSKSVIFYNGDGRGNCVVIIKRSPACKLQVGL